MRDNEMTLEEIFVNTLKVLVLANENKDILYEKELDDYYKTLVVIFGYLCIAQQLKYNAEDEYEKLKAEANEYYKKIIEMKNVSENSLPDKATIDQYKQAIRVNLNGMRNLKKNNKTAIYKIYSDRILNRRLSLVNCSCDSIIKALKTSITYDMNKLFERELYIDSDNSRILCFEELKQIHDVLVDKKLHQEFKKDFYLIFNRKEVKFLKSCYANPESLALKSFYNILLNNLSRAVKLLRVIFRENNLNNGKEFDITKIEEYYSEYKKGKCKYSSEFISTYEYVKYINNLLNKIESLMSKDSFLKKIDRLETTNKKLINVLNNRVLNIKDDNTSDDFEYLSTYNKDYSFLNIDYKSENTKDNLTFGLINDSISLRKITYVDATIIERIQEGAAHINESRYAIENLSLKTYTEAIKEQIAQAYRQEAYSAFVLNENYNKKDALKPKEYKKRNLNGDFNKVFIHCVNSNAFSKHDDFKVDPNLVIKYLIDENGIWTKMDFYLLLEKITRAYFDNNGDAKPLSRETIDLFFSKFTDTFNGISNKKDIKKIIDSFLRTFRDEDLTGLIGNSEFDDAVNKVCDASTYKGDYLIKLKKLI